MSLSYFFCTKFHAAFTATQLLGSVYLFIPLFQSIIALYLVL